MRIIWTGLLFVLGLFSVVNSGTLVAQTKPHYFRLSSPEKGVVIKQDTVQFVWEHKSDPGNLDFQVQHYEITFWSNSRRFGKTYTVVPENDNLEWIVFTLENIKQEFHRHGEYSWRVMAFDASGNSTPSEIRYFIVGISDEFRRSSQWNFLYALQFEYSQRNNTPEYLEFLKGVSTTANLESYYDIGFVFRQDGTLISFLDLKEKFYLLSQVGLGWEFSTRIKLMKTLYAAFYPQASVASFWSSTGLEGFSSTLLSVRAGLDMDVMPKGFLSFRGSWIPQYDIRYNQTEGGLRTFKGSGWELGFRVVISNTILRPFRVFGVDVDFEKIPFEVHFSHIQDDFTETWMKMRRFSVSIMLQ